MIKFSIDLPVGYTDEDIRQIVTSAYPISRDEIKEIRILERGLKLTDGSAPAYKCTIALSLSAERERGMLKIRNKVTEYNEEIFSVKPTGWSFRPVVIGAGPAGLFAALALAEAGANPIILERGESVEKRCASVVRFNTLGKLDEESNVQFGEGGAGAFSDGKLKTGAKDGYKNRVLYEFIEAGATDDIFFSKTAHLGTDKLPRIIRNLREKIISMGAEFIFSARVIDIKSSKDSVKEITYMKDGREYHIETEAIILATGHSARDTIKMLYTKGVMMESRPFGIGMRIEHPRQYINSLVYGKHSEVIDESASYHLVTHLPSGRSVYSFCMCPGGTVVAATSEKGCVVTNGMSEYSRMADNSNSALLVSVTPKDLGSEHPLSGIELQDQIERRAYSLTNEYRAPAALLGNLMKSDTGMDFGSVNPSYPRGVELISPSEYLPDYITDSIREGILDFDKWMPGFNHPGAVLTGPETRTTSPVRILRGEDGESVTHKGLFPTGEGAGYAGGIISSATDGIRQAEKLILRYSK